MTRSLFRRLSIAVLVLMTSTAVFAQADPHAGHHQESSAPAMPPDSTNAATPDGAASSTPEELPSFIPRLTDGDRSAAFPDVDGHRIHGNSVNYFVLFDQLEWQAGHGSSGVNVDGRGWVGRDRDRLWFRAETDGRGGRVGEAQASVLYGRQFSRWWDVVAGVRQDVRPGPAQTWAAVGIQGLAPYWFEVEATAYVGASGRTRARVDVEYELLLTNRLILQPLIEAEVFGRSDPERGVGAGLSSTNMGWRVRYEWRRELALYVGVTKSRTWGETSDLAEAAGEKSGGARLVTGLRLWF